jgi:hypothetical protein
MGNGMQTAQQQYVLRTDFNQLQARLNASEAEKSKLRVEKEDLSRKYCDKDEECIELKSKSNIGVVLDSLQVRNTFLHKQLEDRRAKEAEEARKKSPNPTPSKKRKSDEDEAARLLLENERLEREFSGQKRAKLSTTEKGVLATVGTAAVGVLALTNPIATVALVLGSGLALGLQKLGVAKMTQE